MKKYAREKNKKNEVSHKRPLRKHSQDLGNTVQEQ